MYVLNIYYVIIYNRFFYITSGCCGIRDVKKVLITVHKVVIRRSFCLVVVSSVFPFCSCDKFMLSSTCSSCGSG